jgi:hypothetical protein
MNRSTQNHGPTGGLTPTNRPPCWALKLREIDVHAFRRYSAPSTCVITLGYFGIGHIADKRDSLALPAQYCANASARRLALRTANLRQCGYQASTAAGSPTRRGSPLLDDGVGSSVSVTQPASTPAHEQQ